MNNLENKSIEFENIEHYNAELGSSKIMSVEFESKHKEKRTTIISEKIGKLVIGVLLITFIILFVPQLRNFENKSVQILKSLFTINNLKNIKLYTLNYICITFSTITLLIFLIMWIIKLFDIPFRYIYINNKFEYRFIFITNTLLNLFIFCVMTLGLNNITANKIVNIYDLVSDPGKILGYSSMYLYSLISIIFVIKRIRILDINREKEIIYKQMLFGKEYSKQNEALLYSINNKNMLYLYSRKGSGKSKYFFNKFYEKNSSLDYSVQLKINRLQSQFIHVSCSDLMHSDEDLYVKLWNKLININSLQSIFKSKIGMDFKFNKSSNSFSKLASKIIIIDDLELLYDSVYWDNAESVQLTKEQKKVINKFFGFFKLVEDYFENESNRKYKPIIIFTSSSNPIRVLNESDSEFFEHKLGDISIHRNEILKIPLFNINMNYLTTIEDNNEKVYKNLINSKEFWNSNNEVPELWDNLHNIRHWKNSNFTNKNLSDAIYKRLNFINENSRLWNEYFVENKRNQSISNTEVDNRSWKLSNKLLDLLLEKKSWFTLRIALSRIKLNRENWKLVFFLIQAPIEYFENEKILYNFGRSNSKIIIWNLLSKNQIISCDNYVLLLAFAKVNSEKFHYSRNWESILMIKMILDSNIKNNEENNKLYKQKKHILFRQLENINSKGSKLELIWNVLNYGYEFNGTKIINEINLENKLLLNNYYENWEVILRCSYIFNLTLSEFKQLYMMDRSENNKLDLGLSNLELEKIFIDGLILFSQENDFIKIDLSLIEKKNNK